MRPALSSRLPILVHFICFVLLSLSNPTRAIKFVLPAVRYPPPKCIWNTAHANSLVIVTAHVSPGDYQRTDIEIIDDSPERRVYLSKKNIKGETRLAITAHADGDIGVCLKNYLIHDAPADTLASLIRTIDLDVDIGASAIDYNAIANQEMLSGLEVEMRKLEGMVKELVDEMEFLQRREERFTNTNLSTYQRVQNFAWFTLASLTGLGIWQIFHLRAYFKRKYLID